MKDLLHSKRVRIALVGLILWAAGRFGLELDAAAVDRVLDLAMALVLSYGATGWGKERVAEAAKTGGIVTSVEVTTTSPPPVAPDPALPLPSPEAMARRRRGEPSPTGETRDLGPQAKWLREEAETQRDALRPEGPKR